ncbi:MAG: type II secretion system protein GspM [Gammaproteobacteria bacterium]|nr:type II secretion system protein GspM [Gammaproteobacteria bacterium]MDX2461769.1 type II secretion system protein GspM [Gammaproteobacteria bacterium]
MIAQLPRAQRRILAVLFLLAAVAAVVGLIVWPIWSTYVENRDAIAQTEDNISRYSRLSIQVDALRSVVAELEQADNLDRYVFPQESEPLAAAALQDRIKSVVTNSGGTLTSTQVLPAVADQGFKRVVVNVRMAVSVEALQRVLYALESNLPYLLADEIVILSRSAGKRRRNADKRRRNADAVDSLNVVFNLYGFMRDAGDPV